MEFRGVSEVGLRIPITILDHGRILGSEPYLISCDFFDFGPNNTPSSVIASTVGNIPPKGFSM